MPFAVKTTRAGGVFILKPDTNRQSLFSAKQQKSIKKHPPDGGCFFIGSGCLIRTGDQSVNSRLLYR